jgi:hypothetical protein
MNNKFLFICILIMSAGVFYISFSQLNNEQDTQTSNNLDKNFNIQMKEIEKYPNGMIVKYDKETGDIIGKRERGTTGVVTLTKSESVLLDELPLNCLIIEDNLPPTKIIERYIE